MGSHDGHTNPLDEANDGEERQEGRASEPAAAATGPEAEAEAAEQAATADEAAPELSPEEAAWAEVARLKDQLLRTAADFDNYRKRARRDVVEAERRARDETLREVLPVIDNLERAVQASESAKDAAAVAEGVRMVLKQFDDVASRLDLERISAVGERFDPSLHDAVQQMETSEHPPGTIMAEVVPGYRLGDRLLRAALVVVARPPSDGGDES